MSCGELSVKSVSIVDSSSAGEASKVRSVVSARPCERLFVINMRIKAQSFVCFACCTAVHLPHTTPGSCGGGVYEGSRACCASLITAMY